MPPMSSYPIPIDSTQQLEQADKALLRDARTGLFLSTLAGAGSMAVLFLLPLALILPLSVVLGLLVACLGGALLLVPWRNTPLLVAHAGVAPTPQLSSLEPLLEAILHEHHHPPGPTTVAWRTQVLDNIPHIHLDTTAAGPIALTPTQAAALVLHLTHGQGRWALPHGDSATRWLDLSPLSAHQRMAQAQHLLSRPIP